MSKVYTIWVKKKNHLFVWNECAYCGYRSMSTIWHDDVIYRICPGCGIEMENGGKPKSKTSIARQTALNDISKQSPIGECLMHEDECKDKSCLHCGWNDTEYRRRLQCPWVLKDGLWHLNITKK